MNVMEALESLTTAMELMQEGRKRQDTRIKNLQLRTNILYAAIAVLGVIVLLRGLRGN